MKRYSISDFENILGIKSIINMADLVAIYYKDSNLCCLCRDRHGDYNPGLILTRTELSNMMEKSNYPILLNSAYLEYNLSLNEKIKDLGYTLQGVMYSVDKWFDEVDESKDEVNRAVDAREIALKAIEDRDELIYRIKESVEELIKKYVETEDSCRYPSSRLIHRKVLEPIYRFYNK